MSSIRKRRSQRSRRKKMARTPVRIGAFDCDGTFEREQFLALFISAGIMLGVFPQSLGEEFEALRLRHRDRHISFESYDRTMIEMFLTHVRGLPESEIARIGEYIFTRDRDWNYRFTKALMRAIKPTHRTIMITGALEQIAKLIAPYWGFDAHAATVMEVDAGGRLTGKAAQLPVSDKRTALLRFVKETPGATLEGSVSIGDTLSDLPMLDLADKPIAFNPDYALAVPTQENGWAHVVERKDVIYVIPPDCPIFPASKADEAVAYALSLRRKKSP
jgi:phosphoserine phosphatase